MLTYEDCLALAELTEEEVEAIAEHEHLPPMVAMELGNYLVHRSDGVPMLKRIILDDIHEAAKKGEMARVLRLRQVLAHFVKTHPEARKCSPKKVVLPH